MTEQEKIDNAIREAREAAHVVLLKHLDSIQGIAIEIFEDPRDSRLEMAKEELRDFLQEKVEAGEKAKEIRRKNEFSDRISEIADSCTPVYHYEINEWWFLHGSELEEAYDDAGIGDNPRENFGMAAICLWLESELRDYAEEWLNEQEEREDGEDDL